MKLSFSFKNMEGKRQLPKTPSFRASYELIKADNFVDFDESDEVGLPDTWFMTSNEASERLFLDGEEPFEVVLQELLHSERLFFDPEETRSILKQEKVQLLPFVDSVAVTMESKDPYEDFRRSMEEMVETHGLREWECLDELLGWYLRVNVKKNHGFIIGAFVDLLVGIISTSGSDSESFSSSSPISPLLEKGSVSYEGNLAIS